MAMAAPAKTTRTRARAKKAAVERRIVVALDGPASSGKSSVGAAAAGRLGLRFVDTGLLYRALTAAALREGIATDDAAGLVALADRVTLGDDGTGRLTTVLLDGEDTTVQARGPEVDAAVSSVSKLAEVRQALLPRQRALAEGGGIVVAGRDIGTVVLPDADLKLFLDASVEERAARRIDERGLDPAGDEAEAVRAQLRDRDDQDRNRAVAPLRAADDAVIISTDGNTFERTVDIVEGAIRNVETAIVPGTPAPVPAVEPAPAPHPVAAATEPARDAPSARRPARRGAGETFGELRASHAARQRPDDARAHGRAVLADPGPRVRQRPHRRPRADPAHRCRDPRHQPRLERRRLRHGLVDHPALKQRRIHWLGKKELFDWPGFGWLAARGGVHPVDRGAADIEAFRLATRILESGYVLLIFPEGTRSPDGQLQEAKDGLAMLALRTGAAIVPVGINGSDRVWPKGRKVPLPIPRRTVTVHVGTPFRLADVVPAGADRKAAKAIATTAIMGRIAALLEPRQRGVYADAVPDDVALASARGPSET